MDTRHKNPQQPAGARSTQLFMYNLPPGGGGGPPQNNDIRQVLGGVLTVGAIILFFLSPLGGLFFAITNSLLILAIITPILAVVAFQVWQSVSTIRGSCPNCGAPDQIVLKDTDQVSFCFNCGAFLTASSGKKTIELANRAGAGGGGVGGRDYIDEDTNNGMGDPVSMFDALFNNNGGPGMGSKEQPSQSAAKEKAQKFKREQTIIDVDVTKDDP